MKPWKRIEPTVVSKIGWRTVITKLFEMPDGNVKDWQTINHEDSQNIATIALTKNNQVIIARMFRPGPEQIMDELSGGGFEVKKDTNLESAARRELLEETSYEAGSMTFLGKTITGAYNNDVNNYFLARDCVLHSDGQNLDEGAEFIDVHLISIDELFENARSGKMTDVAGVFLAYEQLRQINQGE